VPVPVAQPDPVLTTAPVPDAPAGPASPVPATNAAVPSRLVPVSRPAVTGVRRAGAVVRVSPGRWSPVVTTRRYQWFRGSRPVTGARTRSYLVRTADVGRRLRVRVTASRVGLMSSVVWVAVPTKRR
jgi:hypothetical protein